MIEHGVQIDGLLASLDLAVFERAGKERFRPIGRLPDWWAHVSPGEQEGTYDLADRFPMLELFLADARTVWDGALTRIESDIWTEHDAQGQTLYLRALAVRIGTRSFIVLLTHSRDLFNYQQLAHDLELQKETTERMSHELDLRRLEAERATRAKSDFLAMMSHEIRTPLNAIIGMADLLSATALTPPQQTYVEIFQRNGVALLNLINDILDLSKVEAGKIELESVEMHLEDVIGSAMEVVEGRARAKRLSLLSAIDPSVPVHLVGDPNRLRQVLINLIGNSIKFTDRGQIELRVSRDPKSDRAGRLQFAVSDTGIGIPESKVGLLFESFTQADTSTTRKYGGTGLGLSISKQLVDLMGGQMWVESQLGMGSTFFFTAEFPVCDGSSAVAQPSPAQILEADLEATVSGLRILLADDSEDNRFLMFSYLHHLDCAIEIAPDGETAVQRFRSRRFDVVLMDNEMPVMDGHTACREIRRYEHENNLPPTPVLILTAHSVAAFATESLNAGFTGHLTKPIRKTTLLEALARCARPDQSRIGKTVPLPPAGTASQVHGSPSGRIRVQVGKSMEESVPRYLEKRHSEIARYDEALRSGDFDTICTLGHNMKGTGFGYGFESLTSLGAAIERAARSRDAEGVRAAVAEVVRFLDNVEVEYVQ